MAIGVLTGQMGRPSSRPNRPSADWAPAFVWVLRGVGGWFYNGKMAREKALKPTKGGYKICVFEKVVKIP